MIATLSNWMKTIAAWLLPAFHRIARTVSLLNSPKGDMPIGPVEPKRLTVVDQWEFLTGIIKGAHRRAEEAAQCHASATMQLDLAQYALASLVDDLSAVMNIAGRPRRAPAYVFNPVTPRPIREAIAA